jgi:hypothetical protein
MQQARSDLVWSHHVTLIQVVVLALLVAAMIFLGGH